MMGRRKLQCWTVGIVVAGALLAMATLHRQPVSIQGAILASDSDPAKRSPLSGIEVYVAGSKRAAAKSDFSGYFRVTLPPGIRWGDQVSLEFRRDGYQPLNLTAPARDQLYILQMTQTRSEARERNGRLSTITDVVIPYMAPSAPVEVNTGSATKVFEVRNQANVPCKAPPCSPDGKWQAVTASASLDAGEEGFFQDASVSCVAGSCPFTKIVSDQFSKGGRKIAVHVLDWGDTTTFVLEAEAFQKQVRYRSYQYYPIIFGHSMGFLLPAKAEGASVEATLDGTPIVFPLGPVPMLSWADCQVQVQSDKSRSYRCDLKPGYRFAPDAKSAAPKSWLPIPDADGGS